MSAASHLDRRLITNRTQSTAVYDLALNTNLLARYGQKKQRRDLLGGYLSAFRSYDDVQCRFLRAVEKHANSVLVSLSVSVLPLYKQLVLHLEGDNTDIKLQLYQKFIAATWSWAAQHRFIKADDVDNLIAVSDLKLFMALPFLGVASSKIGLNASDQLTDVSDCLAHFLGRPVHVQQRPRP